MRCHLKCQSILLTVTKTLATMRLALSETWWQLFTDDTSIRQTPLQDIYFSLKDSDVFRPVVLMSATLLENGETSVAVCDTILLTIQDSGELLKGSKKVAERESFLTMFTICQTLQK